MFGKPRDITETATIDTGSFDEILGDEAAAESALEVHELRHRLEQVESQISSQFTSLATYAQIAQEQVELARAEAKAATERSEERVTSLVERERADRITASTGAPAGSTPAGSAPDVATRLDGLEQSVADITKSLDECRQWQKELALAITEMFERLDAPPTRVQAPAALDAPLRPPVPLAAPPPFDAPSPFDSPPASAASRTDGPIAGLALDG